MDEQERNDWLEEPENISQESEVDEEIDAPEEMPEPEAEDVPAEAELPSMAEERFGDQQPIYYAVPVTQAQRKAAKRKERKPRKGMSALGVIALCLICALLGGSVVGLMMSHRAQPVEQHSDRALEERIAALEKSLQKQPQQQIYDAQPAVDTTTVYEQNVSSVVGVTNGATRTNVFGQTTNIASSGSGFIVREDGYIVTNFHVVEGAETLHVSLKTGEEFSAQVIGYDSDFDVAVLKIDAAGLPAVTIGDSDLLRVGDQVAAIGNPLGELTLSMTVGYVSALDREINTDGRPINMLQTDVAINSGNSGGPLFDMKGNVIGITTAKYSGATSSGASIEGIGFALPINDVMRIVNDVMELGYVSGRAFLGVTTMEMDANTAALYSLPLGVYVDSVMEGSCAQKAGMQKGDIILAVGDQETPTYSALRRALLAYAPGDSTELRIYRAGAELTISLTLDERPSDEEIAAQETPQTQQPVPDQGGRNENIPDGMLPFGDEDMREWFHYFFGN